MEVGALPRLSLLVGALALAGCGATAAKQPDQSASSSLTEGARHQPIPANLRERPIPADLREAVHQAEGIGQALYVHDQVAAFATDVLLARVEGVEDRLGGYLPIPEGDETGQPLGSFLVSFYDRETPPRIIYAVRVKPNQPGELEAFDPPREPPPGFALLAHARQLAIDEMPRAGQPINPVVLPGEAIGKQGILVYLIAGTTQPDLAIFGRHFRALVASDASRVTSMMPLSNGVIEIPIQRGKGMAVGIAITHVVTDLPLETHVFTSLLIELPVYVGTRRGLWKIHDGTIAYLGPLEAEEA